MLLLRLSFLDRTVSFEELIEALGGAPSPAGGRRESSPPRERATPSQEPKPTAKAAKTVRASQAAPSSVQDAAPKAASSSAHDPAPKAAPGSADDAWQAWLSEGKTVPKGLSAFLRNATVTDLDDGRVAIGELAGPAAERLGEAVVMAAIREGFAPYLGRPVRLVIESSSPAASAARRVTEDEVRDDTLRALYRQEPRLERAVEELDLELME